MDTKKKMGRIEGLTFSTEEWKTQRCTNLDDTSSNDDQGVDCGAGDEEENLLVLVQVFYILSKQKRCTSHANFNPLHQSLQTNKQILWPSVRKQTIPTEQLPLVGEI
jgi:hypothetical protein